MKKKTNTTARQHTSSPISALLAESTPLEKAQVKNRMELAAKLEDLIAQKNGAKKNLQNK